MADKSKTSQKGTKKSDKSRNPSLKEKEAWLLAAQEKRKEADNRARDLLAQIKSDKKDYREKTTKYIGRAVLNELKDLTKAIDNEDLHAKEKDALDARLNKLEAFFVELLDRQTKKPYERRILAQTVPEYFPGHNFSVERTKDKDTPKEPHIVQEKRPVTSTQPSSDTPSQRPQTTPTNRPSAPQTNPSQTPSHSTSGDESK